MNVLIKNLDGKDYILYIEGVGLTTILSAFIACGKQFDNMYEVTNEEIKAISNYESVFTDGDFVQEVKELAKQCDRKLLSDTKKRIGFTQKRKDFKNKICQKN